MRTLRILVPYLGIAVVLAAIYSGWTIYSRSQANRRVEHAAKVAEAEADRHIVDSLGGDQLKILAFYANPGVVKRGEKALVCYGVSNAKSVRIEPHIDETMPSLSRCLKVSPTRTTEYKLTAEDASGRRAHGSLVIRVE